MHNVNWFLLGIIAAGPLLAVANKISYPSAQKLLGMSLLGAAVIYIGFALVQGNRTWLLIEFVGVPVYATFYWLSNRYSVIWLALGWLLHPVWDVALHLKGPGAHIAPGWYVIACSSFDIIVAGYIIYRSRLALKNP